jgi:hypothetical protein
MNSFTLEASFLGWFNEERITINFSIQTFKTIGRLLGQAFGTYRRLLEEEEIERRIKRE